MGVKVRKRNGSWWVFINHHGRRKARKVGTREAAEPVKREIEARLALGTFNRDAGPAQPTFQTYADKWLASYAEPNLKPSTVGFYRQYLNLYARPRFGSCASTKSRGSTSKSSFRHSSAAACPETLCAWQWRLSAPC